MAKLQSGELSTQAFFRQLPRLVYRLLFLCVAEDRNLLFAAEVPLELRQIYREGYSLSRLRDLAIRSGAHEQQHGPIRSLCITWTLRAMPAPSWVIEQWPGSATIIAVRSQGIRDGRPVDETRYYVTSLRTSAKALLRLVRNRWSIENSWHWARDVALRDDAHR